MTAARKPPGHVDDLAVSPFRAVSPIRRSLPDRHVIWITGIDGRLGLTGAALPGFDSGPPNTVRRSTHGTRPSGSGECWRPRRLTPWLVAPCCRGVNHLGHRAMTALHVRPGTGEAGHVACAVGGPPGVAAKPGDEWKRAHVARPPVTGRP